MAGKRRKTKVRRPSKAELRRRALAGWVTRRQRYTAAEISAQARRGSGRKKRIELESRAVGSKKKTKKLLDKIASLEKQLAKLKKKKKPRELSKQEMIDRIRIIADRLGLTEELSDNLLYGPRHEHFTDEEYTALLTARSDSDFNDVAKKIAAERGLELREVYSNWLSP